MTAFVEAVEPLLWREGTLRLIVIFSLCFCLFFSAVLRLFKGWWAILCRLVELVMFNYTSPKAMLGWHLLPINFTRFRSLKTLIISLTVATLT